MHFHITLLETVLLALTTSTLANNATVSIDPSLTYLLPGNFSGNVTEPFYTSTITNNASIQSDFASASTAPFISYSQEFLSLIGPNPTLTLAVSKSFEFATEMGVWVNINGLNQVWIASPSLNGTSNLWIFDIKTSTIFQPNTSITVLNPNGGYLHSGKVYIVGDGDADTAPAVYEVDPVTYETSIVLNSYYGLRFGGPNDLTWATTKSGKSFMFFTDDPLSEIYNGGEAPQLPDAVWRFDPIGKSLIPVIDRTDILVPNGIRVNKDQTKMYVTDSAPATYGATIGLGGEASSAIYVFDLDEQAFPYNKRLFGLAERGIPDGIHIDDAGRVWTGESDGIVVRSSEGTILGFFNALVLLDEDATGPLQNFALAGDTLVILALDKIWTVKLASAVVTTSM
jgi:gluconolactonase